MRSRSTETAFIREPSESESSNGMAMVSTVAAAAIASSRENMNCGSLIRSEINPIIAAAPYMSKLIIFFIAMMPTNIQNPHTARTVRPDGVSQISSM